MHTLLYPFNLKNFKVYYLLPTNSLTQITKIQQNYKFRILLKCLRYGHPKVELNTHFKILSSILHIFSRGGPNKVNDILHFNKNI